MKLFTLYKNPTDFPNKFVVREFIGDMAIQGDPHFVGDTLDDARASIPKGMVRIPRDPDDDYVIVESYI